MAGSHALATELVYQPIQALEAIPITAPIC